MVIMATFNEKMTALADEIRNKSGREDTLTLDEMAEAVQSIEGGGPSIDPDKIIHTTITSTGNIVVNDVSEVPHTISVKCASPITQYGKNFLQIKPEGSFEGAGLTGTYNADGTVTLHPGTSTNTAVFNFTPTIHGYNKFTLPSAGTYIFSAKNGGSQVYMVIGLVRNGAVTYHTINNYASSIKILEGDQLVCYIQIVKNLTLTEDLTLSLQVELGNGVTEYEKYQGIINTYNPDDNGDIIIPYNGTNITLIADDSNANIELSYNKSYGIQTDYDRFWDNYQQYGNRRNYAQGFYSNGWTSTTFRPKYPIISNSNSFGVFSYSMIEEILVDVDFSTATTIQQAFYSCTKLKTIRYLKLSDTITNMTNTFGQCSKLENITIEGTIGTNLSFANSNLLTHDSLMSIINALKDYSTSGITYTLTLHADSKAKLTDEEKAIATQKGWTLA